MKECEKGCHCWDKFKSHQKDARCCWCQIIPPMHNLTPEERAEKIIRYTEENSVAIFMDGYKGACREWREVITAEIRAAVGESRHAPMGLTEMREREFRCGHDADCSCYSDRLKEQARIEEREACAKVAEESPNQPGAVIHVSEVRHTEPFVTMKELGDHIAWRIRSRGGGVNGVHR